MKRCKLLRGTAILLIPIGFCAWGLRPLPRRVQTYTENGWFVRVEQSRRYELLPFRDWGMRPYSMVGCGPNFTTAVDRYRLGFVAVVDTTSRDCHPVRR